ncbi:MAG: histidine--tRNA ligase [Alphaproteobacteria bacterium]|nr:histidine--tRNA ligase [Alphaproteobacteria bacterium]
MASNANPVRGTKDFLPKEMQIRDAVMQIISDTYKSFGFMHISAPMMEDINRLDKSEGGENLALIFKILKRGEKLNIATAQKENDLADMGLRYDLTVPLSRYYANNRDVLPKPFKALHVDRVFRAERPQKGRLREFYQCDIDILGNKSTDAEKELIFVTSQAMLNIGFKDFKIRINNRQLLNDMVLFCGFKEDEAASVCIVFDKMDKIGIDGVEEDLKAKGFAASAVENFIALLKNPKFGTMDFARTYAHDTSVIDELQDIVQVSNQLADGRYSVEFDPSLVRGQGYYTGPVFEISCGQYASSVGGGGRYDKMVGKEAGEDVPAVGFSIGFERICDVLQEHPEILADKGLKKSMVLVYDEQDSFADIMSTAKRMQTSGFYVSILKRGKKLGKQLDSFVLQGFEYYMIMREMFEPKKMETK